MGDPKGHQHFNPRTPCGVRQFGFDFFDEENVISIHAPLAGCDPRPFSAAASFCISIHAPLAGCDPLARIPCARSCYFNPRTPCGVRPHPAITHASYNGFQSTHPLRGATVFATFRSTTLVFQSTHPLRGATRSDGRFARAVDISIHAPLAGCDSKNVQRKLHFFELADKLSARIAAKKPSAKADRCA